MARRALLTAADRREPAFRRAFIEAVARANGNLPAAQLLALMAEGRLDDAYRLAETAWNAAVETWRVQVARQIREALETGAEVAASAMARLEGRFDVTNPEATAWAAERSAALVTNVSAETRAALRGILTRSVTEGIAPRDTARLIRDVVGLTARQAQAVAGFRAALGQLQAKPSGTVVETALRRLSNRGLTATRLLDLVARYAARLLRQRSVLIARTEIMTALNEGTRQLWAQGVASGDLDSSDLEQEWMIADDERVCPICAPLDGEHAPIGGRFPGAGGSGPPAHPACRCSTGLVRSA